jgi:DHA1 family tetracycline resistance protein-like MFS transporter
LVTVVLDMLALGIVIPVLPRLVLGFEDGDSARAARVLGVFGFVWALMQFVCAPLLGTLSDRFGRRPIILLSNFGLGLDYFLMALAPNLTWLFVGRVLSGITTASYPTAAAYVADVTPPEARAKKFGLLGAAFGLGFVVGPALGGALGTWDPRWPFWVAGALSLLNAAYGLFILPESLAPERRRRERWRIPNPLEPLRLLRASSLMAGIAGAMLLSFLAHESLPSLYVLYATTRFEWSASTIGVALAAIGIASAVVSAAIVGPVVRHLGERRTALLGLGFGAVGFAIYGAADRGWIFASGIAFTGLWGMAGPAMQALLSARVGPESQGQLQGVVAALRGISGMIGPLFFTQTFAFVLAESSALRHPGTPYFVAAALLVASALVAHVFAGAPERGPAGTLSESH